MCPSRCAEILFQSDDGSGNETWRWRTIAPMNNRRRQAGILSLDHLGDVNVQRVLVAGGNNDTAEILTISCSDEADTGQWTLIEPLKWKFGSTTLTIVDSRILAFGELSRHIFVRYLSIVNSIIWFHLKDATVRWTNSPNARMRLPTTVRIVLPNFHLRGSMRVH